MCNNFFRGSIMLSFFLPFTIHYFTSMMPRLIMITLYRKFEMSLQIPCTIILNYKSLTMMHIGK
jgi:hypothetical protein